LDYPGGTAPPFWQRIGIAQIVAVRLSVEGAQRVADAGYWRFPVEGAKRLAPAGAAAAPRPASRRSADIETVTRE
jgi:hypothetical protein